MYYYIIIFCTFISSVCLYANDNQHAVPLLDLNEFYSHEKSTQNKFVSDLGEALHTYGFVLIKNHGIPKQTIDKALGSAQEFFCLPIDVKKQYQGVLLNRGYKSYNPERDDKKSDLQEYWHVGPQITAEECQQAGAPVLHGNVWPLEVVSFRDDLEALYERIRHGGQPILEACSLYMGKERSFLSDITQYGDSVMRVIHYLPNDTVTGEGRWKAPHKDPNLITMIVGVTMEGLELQTLDGSWISVPYVPDAMVVSASNMLESLSNGLIRSAKHRVVIHDANASRYSIPFFFHVQRNLSIGPVPESIEKTGGSALFPAQTAEEALADHNWFTKGPKA